MAGLVPARLAFPPPKRGRDRVGVINFLLRTHRPVFASLSRATSPFQGEVRKSYAGFGPALIYQSAICAPVQNSTSFFFRIC